MYDFVVWVLDKIGLGNVFKNFKVKRLMCIIFFNETKICIEKFTYFQ